MLIRCNGGEVIQELSKPRKECRERDERPREDKFQSSSIKLQEQWEHIIYMAHY